MFNWYGHFHLSENALHQNFVSFQTEFDVTDSQMDSQDFLDERGTLKKKKASIVSKAIMV